MGATVLGMTTTALAPGSVTQPLPTLLDRHRRRAVARVPRLAPGWYLAVEDGGELVIVALREGALHIGRSTAADLSFDDPTVSYRHAVVVHDPRRGPRVLDDRSRTGTLLNGARVAEAPLRHGDELLLGRQRLRVIRVT